jgi:hypothetical protein
MMVVMLYVTNMWMWLANAHLWMIALVLVSTCIVYTRISSARTSLV